MTHKEERDAIEARMVAALASAQAVDADFVLHLALRNRRRWEPSAGDKALKGYYKKSKPARLGAGEGSDRHIGLAVVQIIIPEDIDDDLVQDTYEAIKGDFTTTTDGLEFEDAPSLIAVGKSGNSYLADAMFPFIRYELRTP